MDATTAYNLRAWFALIDFETPKPWHWPVFLDYVATLPEIQTEDDYIAFLPQIFDADSQADFTESDHANIWFHVLLFKLMQYEVYAENPDGFALTAYGDKLAPCGQEQRAALHH